MDKIIQTLNKVNWDFSDYNSSKYPLDINSIPWYPATFPAPIPKYLIALLSNKEDFILDPFGGKGTTIFEAIKQDRNCIYNDINPFAKDIVKSLIECIKQAAKDKSYISRIIENDRTFLKQFKRSDRNDIYTSEEINENHHYDIFIKELELIKGEELSLEIFYWFHIDTLRELCNIYNIIVQSDENEKSIRKAAFVSILKETCSQRGHFTYVTDNCRPKKIKYYNAVQSYLSMLERLNMATIEFLKQFDSLNQPKNILDILDKIIINEGDARSLEWLKNNSIDLVITSPPYLCAQDYTKTMRLINFFFPSDRFNKAANCEIGPRSQRRRKATLIVKNFYDDLKKVFSEVYRVLKNDKIFCLVIGQGSGKITDEYNTIHDINEIIINEIGFKKIFSTIRNISHKSIRIGGVSTEEIIIFKK